MAFIDEMEDLALSLTKLGYRSTTPAREEGDLQWEKLSAAEANRRKKSFIDGYLSKIRTADALIIANYRKHEIEGYVGPNTLMEAAFGYSLGIPVSFLHDPSGQNCGWSPPAAVRCGAARSFRQDRSYRKSRYRDRRS